MGPLENDILAETKAFIAAHKDEQGARGAYVRLLEFINPNDIAKWQKGEIERCTSRQDMMDALANTIGLELVCAGGIIGEAPSVAIAYVMSTATWAVDRALSGRAKLGAVAVDPKTGREAEVTVEGFVRGDPFKR